MKNEVAVHHLIGGVDRPGERHEALLDQAKKALAEGNRLQGIGDISGAVRLFNKVLDLRALEMPERRKVYGKILQLKSITGGNFEDDIQRV